MADKLIIPKADSNFSERSSGVVQTISHDMLVEILRSAGYIRENEDVQGLKIDERGTQIYLE